MQGKEKKNLDLPSLGELKESHRRDYKKLSVTQKLQWLQQANELNYKLFPERYKRVFINLTTRTVILIFAILASGCATTHNMKVKVNPPYSAIKVTTEKGYEKEYTGGKRVIPLHYKADGLGETFTFEFSKKGYIPETRSVNSWALFLGKDTLEINLKPEGSPDLKMTVLLKDKKRDGIQLPPRTNAYAVIIGIKEYKNHIEVKYAENDARELEKILTNPNIGGFKTENVRLKTGDVSRSDIEASLNWLIKKARNEDDLAIFFYSGHGSADLDDTYLVPYDTDINDLQAYGFSREMLKEKLSKVKAGHVVALLDSCYSGRGPRSVTDRDAKLLVNVTPLQIDDKRVVIISSSEGDETSKDYNEKKHGVFTWHLLEGLKGAADRNDGWIDALELYDYLKPRVRETAGHTPELIGDRETARSVQLARYAARLIKYSQEGKFTKIKALYNENIFTAEQFERASREIEEGNISRTLREFFDEELSGKSLGRLY